MVHESQILSLPKIIFNISNINGRILVANPGYELKKLKQYAVSGFNAVRKRRKTGGRRNPVTARSFEDKDVVQKSVGPI